MKYTLEMFTRNIEYLLRYEWESELTIKLKNGNELFIITYTDFIDYYDENNNYQKLNNLKELAEKIDFKQVVSIIEDTGLDLSIPIENQSIIINGKLYISPQE